MPQFHSDVSTQASPVLSSGPRTFKGIDRAEEKEMRFCITSNQDGVFPLQEGLRVESLDSGDEFSLERWIRASDLLSESDAGMAGSATLCTAWELQKKIPPSEVEPTTANQHFAGHIVR